MRKRWRVLRVSASPFGINDMKLKSSYSPDEIYEILCEQVDKPPSILRCLISLNAHYYIGTSPVCGKIEKSQFDLRNRSGPYYSLRVKGFIKKINSGAEIEVRFSKPLFPDLLGLFKNRYEIDKKIIFEFLEDWIKTNTIAEQPL